MPIRKELFWILPLALIGVLEGCSNNDNTPTQPAAGPTSVAELNPPASITYAHGNLTIIGQTVHVEMNNLVNLSLELSYPSKWSVYIRGSGVSYDYYLGDLTPDTSGHCELEATVPSYYNLFASSDRLFKIMLIPINPGFTYYPFVVFGYSASQDIETWSSNSIANLYGTGSYDTTSGVLTIELHNAVFYDPNLDSYADWSYHIVLIHNGSNYVLGEFHNRTATINEEFTKEHLHNSGIDSINPGDILQVYLEPYLWLSPNLHYLIRQGTFGEPSSS